MVRAFSARGSLPTLIAALALASAAPAAASAAEVFGGVFGHDLDIGFTACCYEHGVDIEAGVRSGPFATLGRFADLRGYALGSVNTSGGVDFAAAGVALRIPLGSRVYLQPALGGAVQDGPTDKFQKTSNRLYLGSRFLFEPEVSLGVKLSERWAAEVSYVHISHAQLAGPQNPGMDDAGVRLVYRFGR